MSTVRQAHLPGNYELYDPQTNTLGSGVCKGCWEQEGVSATHPLQTVWVSVEGRPMIWWLCRYHVDAVKAGGPDLKIVRSQDGVLPHPRI